MDRLDDERNYSFVDTPEELGNAVLPLPSQQGDPHGGNVAMRRRYSANLSPSCYARGMSGDEELEIFSFELGLGPDGLGATARMGRSLILPRGAT